MCNVGVGAVWGGGWSHYGSGGWVCGGAIARKGMARDILREMPAEKAEICSWMYISKDLSDFQWPIFLMLL